MVLKYFESTLGVVLQHSWYDILYVHEAIFDFSNLLPFFTLSMSLLYFAKTNIYIHLTIQDSTLDIFKITSFILHLDSPQPIRITYVHNAIWNLSFEAGGAISRYHLSFHFRFHVDMAHKMKLQTATWAQSKGALKSSSKIKQRQYLKSKCTLKHAFLPPPPKKNQILGKKCFLQRFLV